MPPQCVLAHISPAGFGNMLRRCWQEVEDERAEVDIIVHRMNHGAN